MKNDESELILLDISSISLLVKDRLNKEFIPFNTAAPLLEPPPNPAFIGIFFEIEISTFGMSGNFSLSNLYAMVPKFSFSFIDERFVLQENAFASLMLTLSYRLIS